MKTGDRFDLANGLRISCDWLSWTFKELCTPSDVLSMLGYKESEFVALPTGRYGYFNQLKHTRYPISILYNGREGMGVHVDVSGSALADVLSHFRASRLSSTPFGTTAYHSETFSSVLYDLLACIRKSGNFTRFDSAIDDIGAKFYTVADLYNEIKSGNCVCKFRKYKNLEERQFSGDVTGHTLYLGSRTSEIMFRVYDKQLEQNQKALSSGSDPVLTPWVRWEMELKDSRADAFVDSLLSGISLPQATVGVLSNYIRLIVPDNARKNRCSISETWRLFLDGISKLRLFVASAKMTLEKSFFYLKKQYGAIMAAIVQAEGGSVDVFHDIVTYGNSHMRKRHYDMIANYIPVDGGAHSVPV